MRLKMVDVVEFFETPTDPAILVQNDTASFHLGNSLATAAASLFFQEEGKVPANEGSLSSLHDMEATANPNNLHIIPRGTPGIFSKVEGRSSGVEAAVKKLIFAGNLGNILSAKREMKMHGMVKHRNIVKMYGSSIKKDEGRLWYEYLSSGSLHDVLHEKKPPQSLKWDVCYRIAAGIAKGLAYLHHDCDPPIVHCAIKTKNILLDSDMEPRIADFGTAKLLFQSSTTPSSSIVGTSGTKNIYATKITREFDVYSYGIVLLQLITRKKAIDSSFMGGTEIGVWVRSLWEETGDIHKIVDSNLAEEVLNSNSSVLEEVSQVLSLALRCTEADPCMRPSMKDVTNHLLGFEFKFKSTRTSEQSVSDALETLRDRYMFETAYNRFIKKFIDSWGGKKK